MKKRVAPTGLTLAALGVVFGDIGTSPLYALRAAFSEHGLPLTNETIYGVISLILWVVVLVVGVKYVGIMMRLDNHGEGGDMTLLALLTKNKLPRNVMGGIVILGLVGVSLFYGDSIMTPAISLLSSVEGIKTVSPGLGYLVVPIAVIIAAALFVLQKRGTGVIGRLFGPIMAVWFILSGIVGFLQVIQHPGVLIGILPTTALGFVLTHPLWAFLALGAVVLAVTGAEALYADMGHFGRPAIRRAWFGLVFPALVLCYLGQAALVVNDPSTLSHSYFLLYPDSLRIVAVIVATLATIIASQAVIAGAFSLSKQAAQLGYLPHFLIKHTSEDEEGQVYIAGINWAMAIAVIVLMLTFGSSEALAGAFGFAVAGTMFIDTVLLLLTVRYKPRLAKTWMLYVGLLLLAVDGTFVAATSSKIPHGAWVSLGVAIVVFTFMSTWTKGHKIIIGEQHRVEQPLDEFVHELNQYQVTRVPETASVYLAQDYLRAPEALLTAARELKELPETVILVTVETVHHPHVPPSERVIINNVTYPRDGISQLQLRFGFDDTPNIPRILEHIRQQGEFRFDPNKLTYVVSSNRLALTHQQEMSKWRKRLFAIMQRNETSMVDYFHLPNDRTIDMSARLEI